MPELIVSTCQMAKWRSVKKLRPESNLVDTTVRSGDRNLAPTWNMVYLVKSQYATPEEFAAAYADYTRTYRKLIHARYREDRERFLKYLYGKEVTFMCYCKAGEFCHRHLLVKFIKVLARIHKVEITDLGELS
ncbi:MAG: DUF488 family protein, N3 subclade [Shewanella sp.]